MAPALLAFETAARSASACVIAADGSEIAYADLAGGETEAGLVPLLDRLLRDHGIPRALAVSAGPGSFTGLRVGIAAARTLAWIERLRVHAVDTLAARALEAGNGLWWVLVPLKRDTTFHGCFRVTGGAIETIVATSAQPDDEPPVLPASAADAVAIGPALATKSDLLARWRPATAIGSAAALTARGVARAAGTVAAVDWDDVRPAYHQLSAPELQRRRG